MLYSSLNIIIFPNLFTIFTKITFLNFLNSLKEVKKLKTNQKIVLAIIITTAIFLSINSAFSANIEVNPGDDIQTAIDNSVPGDTITVNDNNGAPAKYTTNFEINKEKLTIKSHGDVTIEAKTKNKPVVHIDQRGSESTLEGFKITGANENGGCGINLYYVHGARILRNEIMNNVNGIYITGYNNVLIYGNNIHDNTNDGIVYQKYGLNGIRNSIPAHNEVMIETNNIINNKRNGISIYEYSNHMNTVPSKYKSSSTPGYIAETYITIKFNRIAKNKAFGVADYEQVTQLFLYNQIEPTLKIVAINNWWGFDKLEDVKKQIYDPSSKITWQPYIVLKLVPEKVKIKAGQSVPIIAYLIYNSNNEDTSSLGKLPEGIPIFFTTNFGAIGSKTKWTETKDGKAQVILTATQKGLATISASADNTIRYIKVEIEAAAEPTQNKTKETAAYGETVAMQPTGIPFIGLLFALLLIAIGTTFKK